MICVNIKGDGASSIFSLEEPSIWLAHQGDIGLSYRALQLTDNARFVSMAAQVSTSSQLGVPAALPSPHARFTLPPPPSSSPLRSGFCASFLIASHLLPNTPLLRPSDFLYSFKNLQPLLEGNSNAGHSQTMFILLHSCLHGSHQEGCMPLVTGQIRTPATGHQYSCPGSLASGQATMERNHHPSLSQQ